MAEELTCRRATLEDRQAVVNILTAFGGRDYMPDQYSNMIQDPYFVGVLGELRGEVVAFAGAYVINGGTTMMTKGSRVKEGLQGRGIYGRLWRYLRDTIKDRAPGLKHEEFSCNTENPMFKVPESQRKYSELYRTPINVYILRREIISKLPSDPCIHVQEIGMDELRRILTDKDLSSILFPRRLVINWHVYFPIVENVDVIASLEPYITRSLSPGRDKSSDLIIFGVWFQSTDHLAYNLDVYGDANNVECIVEHLKLHAFKAMAVSDGEIRFMVFAESKLLRPIDVACQQLHTIPGQFFSTHCVAVVRDVETE
ncbi:histidine N-acetyltransferase-like [Liolophura sinensis]|uniref:histidine N-acetyltransferase-like n=1 Tax=Liolophura sinensis TaxID=3198878 RepID=UPI00315943C6